MSRLPASALEEGDQIHAILRPLLAEAGAAKRRTLALTQRNDARPLALTELDQAIDALLLRMRVDPRPPKSKTSATQKAAGGTREQPAAPGRAATREGVRPEPRRDVPPQLEARTHEPPPVPPAKVRDTDHDRPAAPPDAKSVPPPVPPPRQTTRNLERPEVVVPAVPVAETGPPTGRIASTPKRVAPPVRAADEASGPIVLARPGTAPETFLLYDDIVMLSTINDRDGLLISLERLLILAKLEDHIQQFVDNNEAKLLGLYEAQLKSFVKVPRKKIAAVDNTMPRVFLRGEKIAAILALIDGKASINDILGRASGMHRIEALSVLAQLQRAGIIDV